MVRISKNMQRLMALLSLASASAMSSTAQLPSALSTTSTTAAARAVSSPTVHRPKLVVAVSIDQFRGDYVSRFEPFLGPDGFRRILREGFEFQQCLYATANTETGPGHSTMLTGAYAHRSGIVQNDWFSSTLAREVYCVEDNTTSKLLTAGRGTPRGAGRSPRNLLVGTVGDSLELATAGASKTISLSLKDRAAVLMGGHAADLALWFDQTTGDFFSSNYYGAALPSWVDDFNAGKDGKRVADTWFKQPWSLSLSDQSLYASRCTIDDYPSEGGRGAGYSGNTFPHVLGERDATPRAGYYATLYTSPFGNDLLLQLVKTAITAEQLGKDATPDLLTISFSSNDPVGHAFGPDSWEVMDTTIKTDAILADLMNFLDAQVGKGEWSLLLTADHGINEFPEVSRDHRINAQRVPKAPLQSGLEQFLKSTAGTSAFTGNFISLLDPPWVTFNPKAVAGLTSEARNALASDAAQWLAARPEVAFSISTHDLLTQPAEGDDLRTALRNSYYPTRAGDVALLMRPHDLLNSSPTGTSHGSIWRYDQFVPMLAIGSGIRHGQSAQRVQPPQMAPTVAVLLGVTPPSGCEVEALTAALDHE